MFQIQTQYDTKKLCLTFFYVLKVAPGRKKKHAPSIILGLVTQIFNNKMEGVEHSIKQYQYPIAGLS